MHPSDIHFVPQTSQTTTLTQADHGVFDSFSLGGASAAGPGVGMSNSGGAGSKGLAAAGGSVPNGGAVAGSEDFELARAAAAASVWPTVPGAAFGFSSTGGFRPGGATAGAAASGRGWLFSCFTDTGDLAGSFTTGLATGSAGGFTGGGTSGAVTAGAWAAADSTAGGR